ncbi:MAG: hypothetical protein OXT65_06320 [Alphaproteobacteria bacterium]|nr:hypothetical protein [Alphaproteobacteria bacterium]
MNGGDLELACRFAAHFNWIPFDNVLRSARLMPGAQNQRDDGLKITGSN